MRAVLVSAATAAAMLVAVFPAFAVDDLDDDCKWCPSWRSDRSDRPPPLLATPSPVCHLVKARSETRKGHAVYRTIQVCP
jgi:hypothetical protein